MAKQPQQDRAWDFATEAYLPSDDEKPATGNTMVSDAAGFEKTTSLNAHLNAEVIRPGADPDADSESAQ